MKAFNKLLITCVVVISFLACDKVDGPYREENKSGITVGENAIVIEGDTLTFQEQTSVVEKRVLVEDFTGHLCGTCPLGGITLNDTIRPLFGDKVSIVTIHTGHFADVCPSALDCPGSAPAGSFLVDYRTPTGDEWADFFGINAFPLGMTNRSGFPTSNKKVYRDWQAGIEAELAIPSPLRLQLVTTYDEDTRLIRAAARTTIVNNIPDEMKLQLIVIEDSIYDWQQWYSHSPQLVPDYLHRDIFRASMNGDFGVTVFATGGTVDQKFIDGYSLTLDPSWNAEHCSVVAFLYDASSYKIYQVEEVEVR